MKSIVFLIIAGLSWTSLYYFSQICLLLPKNNYHSIPENLNVQGVECQNPVDDCIDENADDLPVHLVRLYHAQPEPWKHSLCWTECLSLLSIMHFMQPRRIYLHTNFPDYWPFDTCENLISNYSSLKIISTRRAFHTGGWRLHSWPSFIAHEADLVKLYALQRYGGLALDFDVFVLPNITHILRILKEYECVISREADMKANIGFIGCRKQARFIGDILHRYRTDYRPEWTYNSGDVPMLLYHADSGHRLNVYLDDETARNPNITERKLMWDRKGLVNWRAKPAYHSFYHNCSFSEADLPFSNTSLAELFTFIVDDSRKEVMERVKRILNISGTVPPAVEPDGQLRVRLF
ncbi:uncharacterized protein LOC129593226 [Paramacrobiotus metropolitanus]|uniref:uncharacterized protein LOC129593226 n=1 Tax=Paramacrobiotus metropolitanus TaxID=2943436 RepID=UPI002445B3B3|nr:uncharacterized protein LOC129593226 [Paramacrobiotus metropolitanus]